jgi:hypothetical protein
MAVKELPKPPQAGTQQHEAQPPSGPKFPSCILSKLKNSLPISICLRLRLRGSAAIAHTELTPATNFSSSVQEIEQMYWCTPGFD